MNRTTQILAARSMLGGRSLATLAAGQTLTTVS